MIQIVNKKREALAELCRKYRVRRLEIFGSAVDRDSFEPKSSDLDFLVEFLPLKRGEHADTYFGLLEDLKYLFGQKVDIVIKRAVTNPYFLESINGNKVELYAA